MPNPLLLILVVEDEYLVQELAQGAFRRWFRHENGVLRRGSRRPARSRSRAILRTAHRHSPERRPHRLERGQARQTELNLDVPVVYVTGAGADQWPRTGCQ